MVLYNLNVQHQHSIYNLQNKSSRRGHYTEENETDFVPFAKKQISHCLIRTAFPLVDVLRTQ